MKKILTIAGSDCSGGAGIQADLKTIAAHDKYGMSIITAITAQNTEGVYGMEAVSLSMVESQFDAVFGDITPDSIKIGMVQNAETIELISRKIKQYRGQNIVIDPVMVSTSGSRLLAEDALTIMKKELFPLGTLITPNIPEAEVLSGIHIETEEDMKIAAKYIFGMTKSAVLVKGGHLKEEALDILYDGKMYIPYAHSRINTKNTHGTGCTLSSAIACNLADEKSLIDCVEDAKKYLTGALKSNIKIGNGNGPLDHMYINR